MRRVTVFALFMALVAGLSGTAAADLKEVDQVDPRRRDAEVFMGVHATRGQVARVRDAIRADEDVLRFAYLDRDAALAEFRRIFRRNREIRQSLRADDLPVSFRVVVRDGRLDSVVSRYEAMPGVDEVTNGRITEADAWSARRACSRTLYDLEVVMAEGATGKQIALAAKRARAYPQVEKVEVADAHEVRAIFECVRGGGSTPLPSPLPPAILHIDVVDPRNRNVRALVAALVPTPGVDRVIQDPSMGPDPLA